MTASIDNSRVWFITGASRGLGRVLTEEVLDSGGRVLATARRTDKIRDLPRRHPGQAAATALDVTDPAQIREAVDRALDEFGRIDVLVNNAGYGLLGALEEFSDEELQIGRAFV